MATWSQFRTAAPDLATTVEERLAATGLALVATLRRDGFPRVSPVEPLIVDGRLYLGMMWRSTKALDLLRDNRCLVHSTITNPDGTEGDCKVYGHAIAIDDAAEREAYCAALERATGMRPEGEFHLFALDVTEVAYVRFGGGCQVTRHWRPGEQVREIDKAV